MMSIHADDRYCSVNCGAKRAGCVLQLCQQLQKKWILMTCYCCTLHNKEPRSKWFIHLYESMLIILVIVREDISRDKTIFRDPISGKDLCCVTCSLIYVI